MAHFNYKTPSEGGKLISKIENRAEPLGSHESDTSYNKQRGEVRILYPYQYPPRAIGSRGRYLFHDQKRKIIP